MTSDQRNVPHLTPNWNFVEAYLDALDTDEEFTFQAIPEADGSLASPTVMHGTLAKMRFKLEALNRAGAGIFVMVNAGDGVIRPGAKTCRTAANVQRVRAVFVDLDGAPIAPVLESALLPDWVVQSSPGRWHAYWKVTDCPPGEFSAVQTALATKYNGDPSVKDLPRVMRVPGFVHRKAQPFCSELWQPANYQQIPRTRHE
jgi:hypothetical protein